MSRALVIAVPLFAGNSASDMIAGIPPVLVIIRISAELEDGILVHLCLRSIPKTLVDVYLGCGKRLEIVGREDRGWMSGTLELEMCEASSVE